MEATNVMRPPALQELQSIDQWVCYTYPEKLPINPKTGGPAKANDPSTWGTHSEAVQALSRNKRYHGVGIEITKELHIAGIDCDDCITSSGKFTPDVDAVVKRLSSFSYVTPSDKGVRVMVHGYIPKALGADPFVDHFEMYCEGRYFTITDKHIKGTPETIEERQDVLTALFNEIVANRKTKSAACSEIRKKIKELSEWTTSGRNELLSKVAFRCGVLIAEKELIQERIEEELLKACQKNGLLDEEEHKTQSTIARCLKAGIDSNNENKTKPTKPEIRSAAPSATADTQTQTAHPILEKAIAEKNVATIYQQAQMLAQLPYEEYYVYKHRIKETFGKAINLNDLDKLVNAARPIRVRDTSAVYEKTTTGMIFSPASGEAIEISNFAAEILADIKTDDGAESMRSYTIQTMLQGRASTFDVLAKEFAKCEWVDEHIGARAQITTGQSMKSHLINAIKSCSDPHEELHYSHTGWRKIDGTMVYLHAGGIVSQVSQVENKNKKDLTQPSLFTNTALQAALQPKFFDISQVSQVSQEIERASVRLTGPLAKYEFSDSQEGLQKAIRASLRFTDLARDTVTMPLYAAHMSAPLGEINFGVHLAGQTGWGKSELAALLQQHYGAAMTADKLPGSWESTENSLEMLLFQAKDTLVVVDDFKPKGAKSDQDRLHAKADRIFRQIGNGAARGRLTSNLEQRAERRPRCLLLSTGEDIPRGQSLKARGVVLIMEDCITVGDAAKRLSEAQKQARSGLYAQAMAGYIQWLAPRVETLQDRLSDLIGAERDSLGIDGHARSGSNTARMLLGMKCFLQFAYEMEAVTSQEAQAYLSRCTAALLQIACEAARENSQERPSEQWRRLVLSAIRSKKAHLVTPDGKNPGHQYGWVRSVRTIERDGEVIEDETFAGGGPQIGWVVEESIYLDPAAAYGVAVAFGSATRDEITTLETTLRKFLVQDKMLASTDLTKARKTITVRRRFGGVQVEVLHFKGGVFYPNDPVDSSDTPDLSDSAASQSASEASSEVSQVDDSKAGESSQVPDSEEKTSDLMVWRRRITAYGEARGFPRLKLSDGTIIPAGEKSWGGFVTWQEYKLRIAYQDIVESRATISA